MNNNNTWWTQPQFMVLGVGDLTFTGLVFSWFLSTGRRKDQELELQLHAVENVAMLFYKLRCEDYYTEVNPTNPCSSLDLTSKPTRELLQMHCCRVSSERINLAHNATKSAWLAQLTHPRKLWKIHLLQKRKHTLKKEQQQHLQVMKFLIIKPHIHLSHILEWWYPMWKAWKWTGP